MKKILTITMIFSCLGLIGCENYFERKKVEKMLKFAKNWQGEDSQTQVCYGDWHSESTFCGNFDVAQFTVVDESAEGKNRVVIKIPCLSDNCGADYFDNGWYHFGVDVTDDLNNWHNLSGTDKIDALKLLITAGSIKYGVLREHNVEGEYYYYNGDTNTYELFSENATAPKDLELMGAKVEDNNAVEVGERLATQYGLSADRSQEIAKTMSAYNKLISKRALTAYEKNQFSTTLLGVDYNTAEKGLKSGDSDDFDSLMEQAAETNGTSPEAVSAIIKDMIL